MGKSAIYISVLSESLKYVTDEDEFDCLPDRIPLRHDVGMYFPAYDDYMINISCPIKRLILNLSNDLQDKIPSLCKSGNINAKIEFYNLLKGFPIINYHSDFINEFT